MPVPKNPNPWTYHCDECGWSEEWLTHLSTCPECSSHDVSGTRPTTEAIAHCLESNAAWLRENRETYAGKWVILDGGRLVGAYETVEELLDTFGKAPGYLVTQVL